MHLPTSIYLVRAFLNGIVVKSDKLYAVGWVTDNDASEFFTKSGISFDKVDVMYIGKENDFD